MTDLYISVGIDVGADFSFMSIALPNQTFVGKPFKITHSNLDSVETAVKKIKEAEESNSLKARIFLESTGIYHYPLFCYLRDKRFDVSIINPIITNNSTNLNIRKVHNDKFDSKKLALIALKPDLKTSVIPSDFVLNIRNLVREYYRFTNQRSAYVNKLTALLKVSFPEYLGIFSKITVNTSLALLDKYPSPDSVLNAKKSNIMGLIKKTARFGTAYADQKYEMLISAAKKAKSFGHSWPSDAELIKLYISMIRNFDNAAQQLICSVKSIVESYPDELFCKQIRLLETIKGCGFLSAVTLMCEIGNFSVFSAPKKLYAYLGLDPSVKQSGKFNGTNVKLSKRGSRLARRVLHMMAINSIGFTKGGKSKNPILRDFYDKKCLSKPKMIALSAVMHKLCNIIFAVLRDNKPFEFISPEQHNLAYRNVS